MKKEIKVGQKYKHFKGGIYEVVEIALDCEDPKKELVIYKHFDEALEHPAGTIWAREKNNFLEEITRDGKTFLRFKEVKADDKK